MNEVKPVAWCWRFPDGEFYEIPHKTKEQCESDCCGYDGEAVPLYELNHQGIRMDVVAMLEEAEYMLKQAGYHCTATQIRRMLEPKP